MGLFELPVLDGIHFFPRFGMFSNIILLSKLFTSSSPPGTPMMGIFVHLSVSHNSCFFTFFFLFLYLVNSK